MAAIEKQPVDDAIEFLEKIKAEKEVTIKFTKKDGSTRIMKATLEFDKIPADKQPKSISLKTILQTLSTHKQLHVYDLEKEGWRTVSLSTVEYLETPTQIFRVAIK